MTRTTKTTRSALIVLMTITLLIYSGCNPASEKEAPVKTETNNPDSDAGSASSTQSDIVTSEPSSNNAVPPQTETNREEPNSQPGIISGDLSSVDWNSMVGQEVTVSGNLVVVDTYDLARRGQVKIARNRLYVPTSQIDPNDSDPSEMSFEGGSNVAKVVKAQKFNDSATLTIDDGSADQNIFPPSLFPNLGRTHPTVRAGSTINGVTGKLVKEKNKLLLVPSEPLQWTPAQRPQRPDVGDANVTISSFNVLNYFTTIDNGSNNARGADSETELQRQESKLVAAITELNADVIGLMEIENNLDAEIRLVAALNKEVGQDVFKGCGLPDGFIETPGGKNAIRVGIIYRTDRVAPIGTVSMISDEAFSNARTPIVQSFKSISAGNPFTVIVNHFKSKGGSSKDDVANKNKGDGQGAHNATRRSQSLAICGYIDGLKQDNKESRILVIGDLNAYEQEDPIDVMRANGLVDLREQFEKSQSVNKEKHYSYIYRGQSGSLDHAMATGPLAADVTGIATWHINADEPRFLDYNEEYNPEILYEANPFRSSDHDPVLIGIRN
ncbi:MAG: ExeM/NucH family extracellular endonuclease [Mariniblastus sp.]